MAGDDGYKQWSDALLDLSEQRARKIIELEQQFATLLDLFIRTRDELWIKTGRTALTDEGQAFLRAHFDKDDHKEASDGE